MDPIDHRERPARLFPRKAAAADTSAFTIDNTKFSAPAAIKKIKNKTAQTAPQDLLEQHLRGKIKQLMQQPAPQQAVVQGVIGALLAWEFNDAMCFEPKFNTLLQRVQEHIENEPTLNNALHKMIAQLSE
jgi:hypothetical protein